MSLVDLQNKYINLLSDKNIELDNANKNLGRNVDKIFQYFNSQAPDTNFIDKTSGKVHPTLNSLLNQEFEWVKSKATKKGFISNLDILVGEYPTGEINASAIIGDEGALLLINTGLWIFAVRIAIILSYRIAATDDNPALIKSFLNA